MISHTCAKKLNLGPYAEKVILQPYTEKLILRTQANNIDSEQFLHFLKLICKFFVYPLKTLK